MKIQNNLMKHCIKKIQEANSDAAFKNPLKVNGNTYSFDVFYENGRKNHLSTEIIFNLFSISDDGLTAKFYVDVAPPLSHMSGFYSAPIFEPLTEDVPEKYSSKRNRIIDRAFLTYVDSIDGYGEEHIYIEQLVRVDNETFEFTYTNPSDDNVGDINIILKLLNFEVDEGAGIVSFDSIFLGGLEHLNEKVEMFIKDLPIINYEEACFIEAIALNHDHVDEFLGRENGFWEEVKYGRSDIKPTELNVLRKFYPPLVEEIKISNGTLFNSIVDEYSSSIKSSEGPIRNLLSSEETLVIAYNEEGLQPIMISDESDNLLITSFEIVDFSFFTKSALIYMQETFGSKVESKLYWRPII